MSASIRVIHGDSRAALKDLADASVDSCACDPPYALVSIGKRFGADGAAPAKSDGASGVYARASAGFMGQTWDTGETAFDPEFWREVWRVLKPGAHVVAFSGTRTYHRLACAIEDAGFEIRDMVAWLYGTGFPKSHDVSKAIDKAAGASRAVVRERYTARRIKPGATVVREGGYGKQDVTFTAADTAPATPEATAWEGWGTALKPALEPIVLARKPLAGTVVATVLAHGCGALNIDGCRIEAEKPTGWSGAAAGGGTWNEETCGLGKPGGARPVKGRWPANVVHDGSAEVVGAFPETASGRLEPHHVKSGAGLGGTPTFAMRDRPGEAGSFGGDAGTAARFFFSAKADALDRHGSKHPTVKPVDLMAWLIRLVTPPGGIVLDPFAGSGTTGIAALREGCAAILIEREAQFVADIERRIAFAAGEGRHSRLERAREVKPVEAAGLDLPLFGGADADTPPRRGEGRRIYGVFADEGGRRDGK